MGDLGDSNLSQLLESSQASGLPTEMEETVGSGSRYVRFVAIKAVCVFRSSYALICFNGFFGHFVLLGCNGCGCMLMFFGLATVFLYCLLSGSGSGFFPFVAVFLFV